MAIAGSWAFLKGYRYKLACESIVRTAYFDIPDDSQEYPKGQDAARKDTGGYQEALAKHDLPVTGSHCQGLPCLPLCITKEAPKQACL